ncbi:predicted protein [Scheffersomyces stipitis CBS 6054]|uniref:MMS19 nucleotide excision repair protein n=1 Tax=Scheffersomyces stipitis (strain ATCC 58785 / CBS 6054 / NBRC 10063 / NRRL Y-11545) TaxID=322104 RepID=A3LP18_PICST|nr:predicted protein [Scheffersomyces stipitis CBS 6054]ABN64411.2 predicted protein [Scheffersomyces stipitis CBS 6054]KAG2735947.1 hypothetical protein G9P44_000037 [Scheffersomyces stipitis]
MVESIHNIPTLINQFIATVDTDSEVSSTYSEQLAELIVEGELTLLQFIQKLGPSLTSDTDAIRSRSVNCLSSTLGSLNGSSKLTKQDVNVIVDFLLSKLDDKACLQYSLAALSTLVKFRNFVPSLNDNLKRLLNAVISEYDPKKNLARTRYESFNILSNTLSAHKDYLITHQDLGDLFVKNFIHVASGEKDPRNLLVSFELNTAINQIFTFDETNELHKEFLTDLFDVAFCYFPISFTPPANDPYKITAHQLKEKLRATISSQTLFAKDSFSNLIEKLTSTNPVIRNDVLKTLLQCVENYSRETVEEYWLTLWNALKFEILHNDVSIFKSHLNEIIPSEYESNIDDNDDNKTLILTLVIISELFQKLEESSSTIQETIIGDLKENLVSIKDKSKQSIIILAAIASQSIHSFNKVVEFVFSYGNWGKYVNVENPSTEAEAIEIDTNEDLVLNIAKQRDLVDNLGFIFTSYFQLFEKLDKNEVNVFAENNKLVDFKDHLLIFLGQLLTNSSSMEKTLKCKVIQQLTKLVTLPLFLNQNENELIFSYFRDVIIGVISSNTLNWEKDIVLKEAISGSIYAIDNDKKIDLAIRLIITNLLDLLENTTDSVTFNKILDIIGDLCINYRILEMLSVRLLNRLIAISQSDKDIEIKVNLFQNIVESLTKWFTKVQTSKQFLTNSWYHNFLPKFFESVFRLLTLHPDYVLVELCGDLVGLIVKFIDQSKHQEILDDFVEAFFTSASSKIIGFERNALDEAVPAIGIFNKAIANVDKAVKIKTFSPAEYLSKVCDVIYTVEDDQFLRIQYLQTLAILVNKFAEDESAIEGKMGEFIGHFTQLTSNSKLSQKDYITFEILIWYIKALVLKVHKLGFEYVNNLVQLLSTSSNLETKELVGRSLMILFTDLKVFTNQTPGIKKVISKVTNLNVKLLYKQRIFEVILPALVDNHKNSENSEIYLNSLSLILKNLSRSILVSHLKEILPLVLTSLTLPKSRLNSTILRSSLNTLFIIIEEDQSIVEGSLAKLIPILLTLATGKIFYRKKLINTEEIRILALQNLIIIFEKYRDLARFKKQTLSSLVPGLDDKRRNVRKLSCDLRQILYTLD